ncbi:hypothetical protein [Brochothrix phage BtpYZU04]
MTIYDKLVSRLAEEDNDVGKWADYEDTICDVLYSYIRVKQERESERGIRSKFIEIYVDRLKREVVKAIVEDLGDEGRYNPHPIAVSRHLTVRELKNYLISQGLTPSEHTVTTEYIILYEQA